VASTTLDFNPTNRTGRYLGNMTIAMREPGVPENEPQRLAALARYEILDTYPELQYDEIVKIAAFICGTPIALISFVDDRRQWFKARVGLDATQTPKSISFCGHVVEQGSMLVIADPLLDERFADNPLVIGDPRIRFYAGAPLLTVDGFTLGSLCVIDHQPRQLSSEQLDMLGALSRVVIRQLDTARIDAARRRAEADAKAARRLRERFFEVSLEMLCIAKFDGYFQELNPAWTKTLGWSVEELCAKPFIDFVHPDDKAKTIAESAALGGGDHITVNFSNRYASKSGEYRWLEWTAAPDTDNQVLIAAARDITATKLYESELLEARRVAETANQSKSDFLAKMSHELRTPLNSVIGFTNLLRRNDKGKLDGKELLFLDKIARNGLHLLSLINDLLDLSKIEAGHTELELGPVDLAALCSAVRDEMEGVISSNGNTLLVSVPAGLSPIRADARRLKQVLINLVGNANKFSKRGDIELRVRTDREQPARAVRIDIVDNGIGIPTAQLELVFEAFRQGSEGGARTHGGTGLGLAISRSLAQLHGFELGVSSIEGAGATFYLKLDPQAPSPQHRPPDHRSRTPSDSEVSAPMPAPSVVVGQRTVLLIEDDSDARELASRAIEQLGARVVTADTGESGFLIAQAIVPDLIVLDLGLPDVPGREIVRRLSGVPRLRSIPVIIYSADSGGIEGVPTASVLEKPVTIDEIASTLSEHLGPRRRVLVVDDDNDTREVLCSVLRNLGVETSEASDGHEALAVLRKTGADMVMLDICMPRMTGFEFLEQLRADPQLGATPVVVCTALDLQPTEAQKLVGGAQDVIRKGFNLEGRIEEVIRVLLPKGPS
jgi:PAS domain S-box-containing protein